MRWDGVKKRVPLLLLDKVEERDGKDLDLRRGEGRRGRGRRRGREKREGEGKVKKEW